MAYDYEKAKQLYESLSPEKQQQFANDNSGHVQEFLKQYNAEKSQSTKPIQNTTQTTGSTVTKTNNNNTTKPSGSTALPEYQGSGSSNSKQSSYTNQGAGNYTYNPTSGYYEKNNNQNYNTIRDAWDSKTYEQQQELLKNNPNLKEGITKVGGTIKQSPYQNQGEGQYQYNPKTGYYEKQGSQGGNETPTNKGGWDYQDNSPERTAEIIRNLDDLSKSNPGLFSDYDTFYNAFIAGKGRSPEQEKVLNDYFNKMKQYNKYDNMSSDELGYLLAHGEPAEDYLSYLKYNDPQRYAEIQESRKKNENQIMNETYLNTVASQAGYDMGDSDFWKWNQEEMGYRDVNKDGLDDRLYHAPTAEELKLVDENNQYEQERAKLTDAYKWLQEDLTNQYPDADLSTIMLLTSDRGNKIQRALDTLAVNQTKVQGSLKYLQNERATMDDAGQKTINEIQKQYGMYYDYSPQGIAEKAQAEYAATNITLDQADNGTDTQKQMALDRVLSDYYDKYGSIIQRSKSQVINDVMAYAKKNGVSLSQALQENFINPLKAKPEYTQMNTDTSGISWGKIGEDADGNAVYGFIDLYNKTITPYGNAISTGAIGNYDTSTRGGKANTIKDIVTYDGTEDLGSVVSDIYNKFNGQNYGECGYLVNDYYKAVTGDTKNLITGTFDDRKGMFTKNTPSAGDIVLFDWNGSSTASDKMKTYGHVALVESTDATGMWIVDANWDGNGTVDRRHINYTDDLYKNRVYGFYEIPEDKKQEPTTNLGTGDYGADAISAFEEFNKLGSKGLDTAAKQKRAKELFDLLGTDENGFKIMANGYWDSENAKQAQANIDMIDQLIADIDNLPSIRMRDRLGTPNSYGAWRNQSDGGYGFSSNVMKELWMDEEDLADYNRWAANYDELMANLMYDKYQDIKSTGGTFGSMSNAEWDNLKQAATNLKFNQDATTYYNNLLKLRKQFEHLASYGNNNKSVLTPQKQNTKSSLMSKFTSY